MKKHLQSSKKNTGDYLDSFGKFSFPLFTYSEETKSKIDHTFLFRHRRIVDINEKKIQEKITQDN